MNFPILTRGSRPWTLLFITPQRLVRADFAKPSTAIITRLWHAPAPPGELLPALAEAALRLGPTHSSATYVLSSAIATQLLNVPSLKIAGLEGEDLIRALGFEAEAVSGLNPFESTLGAQPQGNTHGERQYWITQIANTEFQQLQDALSCHQSALAGVLHPAGLPRPVGAYASGESWQRVEVWNDAVVCVAASADGNSHHHLIPTPPNRTSWEPEVESWAKQSGPTQHRETLVPDTTWFSTGGNGELSLDDEAVLRAFLAAWAQELALPQPRIPIVRPAPRPLAATTRGSIAGGLLLITTLVCLAHWGWLNRQARKLEARLQAAQRSIQQRQALRSETAELESQLAILDDEIASLKSLREDWTHGAPREHRRHASLLTGLMWHAPASLMIESISESPADLRITAVSMTSESPGFGTELAATMEPYGWTIEPPRRKALGLADDCGPWRLEWILRPGIRPGSLSNNITAGNPTRTARL